MTTLEELGYVKEERKNGKEFLDYFNVIYTSTFSSNADSSLPSRIKITNDGDIFLDGFSINDGCFINLELIYAIVYKIQELGFVKNKKLEKKDKDFIDGFLKEVQKIFKELKNKEG